MTRREILHDTGAIAAPEPIPLVDPVHRFVMFTNAKCGGTTVKTWFFDNLGIAALEKQPLRLVRIFGPVYAARHLKDGRARLAAGVAELEDETHPTFITFYRNRYCVPMLASGRTAGFFKFAVVRNPYSRAVSGFVDKFCGVDLVKPWVQDVLARGGRDGRISFTQFLDYLERVEARDCDRHWRQQAFAFDGHDIKAFVRLEALAEDFEPLRPIVGGGAFRHFSRKLQRVAWAPPEAAGEGTLEDMSNVELIEWSRTRGGFPDKSRFLTPTIRARIREIYARDFATLPYGS